jgi:hypothetical protein
MMMVMTDMIFGFLRPCLTGRTRIEAEVPPFLCDKGLQKRLAMYVMR